MDYNEILKKAAGLMGPYCKACPVCNGRACGNCVPGPGSKIPGNTAARNYDKWREIFVNMDTLCPNADADTSFELFGRKFSEGFGKRFVEKKRIVAEAGCSSVVG